MALLLAAWQPSLAWASALLWLAAIAWLPWDGEREQALHLPAGQIVLLCAMLAMLCAVVVARPMPQMAPGSVAVRILWLGGGGPGGGPQPRRRSGIVDLSRRCGVGRIGSRPTTARRSWIQARQDSGELVSIRRLCGLEGLGCLFNLTIELCEALLLTANQLSLSLQ